MPTYDYQCKNCGFHAEAVVPIASRDVPCDVPCQECGETAIERIPGAPGISYTVAGRSGPKTPDSFKDVLRNIKKNHKYSTINV